jgi:hypothetical protein
LGLEGLCPDITHGAYGQILSAKVKVRPEDLGAGTGTNKSSRKHARSLGYDSDDAGHILGKVLGGSGGKGNVFPQLPAVNRGKYREFEKNVKDYIKEHGAVDIEWNFIYGNGGTRPTQIKYTVLKDGKKVLYDVFEN